MLIHYKQQNTISHISSQSLPVYRISGANYSGGQENAEEFSQFTKHQKVDFIERYHEETILGRIQFPTNIGQFYVLVRFRYFSDVYLLEKSVKWKTSR